MCLLRYIAMHDYPESDYWKDTRTDAGQSDPCVPLCFAGDTKTVTSAITIGPFIIQIAL